MELDFTFNKYRELCRAISKSSYVPVTVHEYLLCNPSEGAIILRHDVDGNVKNALKMAKIENEENIKSTYYFRKTPKVFKPKIIKDILDLGHEIGYHYEVLDKAKGDFAKAIKIFNSELIEFKKICDVKTICMHGNPLTKWDNRAIWQYNDYKKFGITGEAYLSIDYNNVAYFTETGRTWAGEKYRIKDFVVSDLKFNAKYTNDLIEIIDKNKIKNISILTHPGQWDDNLIFWAKIWMLRKCKNFIKMTLLK